MNQDFIKAIKFRADRTGWLGRYDKIYSSLRFWWTDSVWIRAPQWMWRTWGKINRFWYEQISTRLFPRQKWLTKVVPRQYMDRPELLVEVMYAFVVNFVSPDGEDALNHCHWEPADEDMLKEIYLWATVGRAAQFALIEAAYPPMPKGDIIAWLNEDDPVRDAAYAEINRLGKGNGNAGYNVSQLGSTEPRKTLDMKTVTSTYNVMQAKVAAILRSKCIWKRYLHFSIYDTIEELTNMDDVVVYPDFTSQLAKGKVRFFTDEDHATHQSDVYTNPTWADVVIEAERSIRHRALSYVGKQTDHVFLESCEPNGRKNGIRQFRLHFGS